MGTDCFTIIATALNCSLNLCGEKQNKTKKNRDGVQVLARPEAMENQRDGGGDRGLLVST